MKAFPNTVIGLIELMEKEVPPRCIGHNETAESAHRYAGQAELVQKIRGRYEAHIARDQKNLPKVIQ